MIFFYGYTQFHVFNIINLKLSLHPEDRAIAVFVRPDDANTKQYYRPLVDNGIVERIIDFDSKWINDADLRSKLRSMPAVIKSILNSHARISKLSFPEKIDILYSYGSSVEMYLLLDHIKKTNNSDVQLVCYEEGTGSYCYPADNRLGRLAKLVIGKILKIDMPAVFDKQLLYQPDCIGTEKKCTLEAMPQIDKRLAPVFNNIFGYADRGDYSRAVFFDGPDYELDKLLRKTIMESGLRGITIKMHPRGVSREYISDETAFLYEGVQWETICANHNTQEKILISHFSTSLFSPKAIYGEEPYLIFLYNLIEIKQLNERKISGSLMDYFEKFKCTYSHPERIFVPNSVPELKHILETIGNGNEQLK